jgi:hypothetical protein
MQFGSLNLVICKKRWQLFSDCAQSMFPLKQEHMFCRPRVKIDKSGLSVLSQSKLQIMEKKDEELELHSISGLPFLHTAQPTYNPETET